MAELLGNFTFYTPDGFFRSIMNKIFSLCLEVAQTVSSLNLITLKIGIVCGIFKSKITT